ncbi:MAG: hypothetical protein MJK14_27920, partial [Rivularia sp. ALOHA_DT_140]|nr:hypothetical protein [Rivularia sp. ALOHA_DT_140]
YRYSELKNAIANGAKKLFIAEREGVADLLWDSGLTATTTIGGAGKYRKYGVGYKEDLEALGDIEIILCPDRDKPGLTHMEEINKDFPNAKWCYAPPEDFYWKNLPKSQGLDVKDWILEGATVEEILAAVEDRRELVEKLNSAVSAPDAEHTGAATCKLAQKYNLIAAAWGYRLRWNSMKKRVEMDGSPLPLDRIKLRVAKELDIELSKEDTLEIVLDLSQDNEYSPFKEYLEALPNGNPEFLNSLASRFLGTHDPLHQVLLKRTLIAAVARTFQPGCKHDTVCILQGKQGALKSTFWSVLAGEDNFTDDLSGTDKDEILKLSQYTMIEFAEFETAYRKKEVSALKAFLSRKSDSIRVPYGRDIQDIPRPSIFVGTTNKPEFLHDPTGERRYWAVPVECDRINIPQLKIDRDAIWAAAKAAYLAGEQWWLTSQEDEMLNTSNSDFASTDVWEEVIGDYVSLQSETSAREILSECLKIDVSMQDRAFQMRVTDILTRLGWRKGKKKKINGKVVQAWDKPTPKCNIKVATEVATQVATQVATTSNVDIASASVNEVATVATFSTNFKNEKIFLFAPIVLAP